MEEWRERTMRSITDILLTLCKLSNGLASTHERLRSKRTAEPVLHLAEDKAADDGTAFNADCSTVPQ